MDVNTVYGSEGFDPAAYAPAIAVPDFANFGIGPDVPINLPAFLSEEVAAPVPAVVSESEPTPVSSGVESAPVHTEES